MKILTMAAPTSRPHSRAFPPTPLEPSWVPTRDLQTQEYARGPRQASGFCAYWEISARRIRTGHNRGIWIGRDPAHEDLIAERQERRPHEHPQDPPGCHAAEGAEQDDRHRRIHSTT